MVLVLGLLMILMMGHGVNGFFWLKPTTTTTQKPTTYPPVKGCDTPDPGMTMCARATSKKLDQKFFITIM